MAENTQIEWCDHTFNPWRGCHKVSPGCDNCYAETLAGRNPAALGEWGKDANRVIGAEAYWRKPEKWERAAAAFEAEHGRRQRVFCASLGDVFENRPDLAAPRLRLLDLIRRTPSLDWLLLTKRPKNVLPLLRQAYEEANAECNDSAEDESDAEHVAHYLDLSRWLDEWISGDYPPENVWLGTSVEDQERADQRVPALLKVPAAVRFLSCEPLLGPVNLVLRGSRIPSWDEDWKLDALTGKEWASPRDDSPPRSDAARVHWVIVGGESGPGARPMHPDWARSLRDQCTAAEVPFLFKQWGAWADLTDDPSVPHRAAEIILPSGERVGAGGKGAGMVSQDWRERGGAWMGRVGKKVAGRVLDGRTHDAFPEPVAA